MRSSRLIGQRNRVLGLRYLSSTQPSRPPGLESDLREHGSHVEVLVIGSGIGGASSALGATTPQLAEPQSKKQLQTGGLVTSLDATGPKKRVLVLESEEDFNYHSTGRSAAIFSEVYGSPTTRSLSKATKAFLYSPKEMGLPSEAPLCVRRGALWVGTKERSKQVTDLYEESKDRFPTLQMLTRDQTIALNPWTDSPELGCSMWEPDAADMDVDAIWTSMTRQAKKNGATFHKGYEVVRATPPSSPSSPWVVEVVSRDSVRNGDSTPITITADTVINAAGAWADVVAQRCGIAPVNLQPKQRTIIIIDPTQVNEGFLSKITSGDIPHVKDIESYLQASSKWPSVFEIEDEYYFKPEGLNLLASPCDVTPVAPCDAQPDDFDIAVCVDRLNNNSPFTPRRIIHSWAGLRTFAPDNEFVIGAEPSHPSFIWMAGLGGYGIQTCMGNARMIAGVFKQNLPEDMLDAGLDPATISPKRFRD